jgi:MGT family glycosyltransferase
VRPRRFLLLTLHAAGNWPPELALVRALAGRGHAVRVVSDAQHAAQVTDAGGEYAPYRHAPGRDPTTRHHEAPDAEMARIMREVFLNRVYADELLEAVDGWAPDVLLVDQMLGMAGGVAESTRLPTAILWHTVYGRADGFRRITGPVLDPLHALRAEKHLPAVADLRASFERAHAIVAFTYEDFDLPPADAPAHLHYVGPLACLPHEVRPYALPWDDDDPRPLVLVSYSTSFQDQVGTLQRVLDAIADLPARVLLTLGEAITADEFRLPANVVAESFVPHAAVLPRASLVVTHAGHGTVMAAATAGVPLVCTPMGRDQHAVAACVEHRRLGVVVPMTASPDELRTTIASALADVALHQRARRFAARQDVAAGRERAVAVLEHL